MILTESAAKKLMCHVSFAGSSGAIFCKASKCMAWRFHKTFVSTSEAALPPSTWPDLAEQYGPKATLKFERNGFCGLAGGAYDE